MKTTLGRTIVLVNDYDEAYDFYRTNFFCEKLFDMTVSDTLRFLHVRFSDDDQSGIWFLKATDAGQQQLVGRQTGGQPLLVVYTDDSKQLFEHVKNNGVEILEPLEETDESSYFHCADLYGNRITVVELH
ncbi:MAG TPA: VOC family protein [Sphingobacterium sp.]|jgi:predicted enzyme related to lactoylglutathione lyase|nr:VOC family protein [Sphingobacterium sp.]